MGKKRLKMVLAIVLVLVFVVALIPTEATSTNDPNTVPENILRGRNNKRISIDGVYGTVDQIHSIKRYNSGSGYYGKQVADVARSYYLAEKTGAAKFKYNQSSTSGLFNGKATNANGECELDCSGFISLVLRGIDYEHSPFNGATGTINKTFQSSNIATLCQNSEYVWADDYLDAQTESCFKNIGISGKYSIRTAADIAEYYYAQGCAVYEFSNDQTSAPTDLQPGDILFWSKDGASDAQKSRFKAISHVGIVDTDTSKFFHVTTTNAAGKTVYYSKLSDKLQYLSLIVRPNYIPISTDITSPINTNLIPQNAYADYDSVTNTSVNKNGLIFTLNTDGLDVKGKGTSGTTFYLYNRELPLTLTPGRYTLSGSPTFPGISTTSSSTKWGISIKDVNGNTLPDINGKRAWDRGQSCTFDITQTTNVYVYIYISADLTLSTPYTFHPSLVRLY